MSPEVSNQRSQVRRFTIALITFLVLMPLTAGTSLLLSLMAISVAFGGWDFFIAAWNDPDLAKSHNWIFYSALALTALAMLTAWYLWSRLFLRSGYLNDEMVALMKRGHGEWPGNGEILRKGIGYTVYGLIAGLLAMKLYVEDEFMLAMIPFAATVYTVLHAWHDPVWARWKRSAPPHKEDGP